VRPTGCVAPVKGGWVTSRWPCRREREGEREGRGRERGGREREKGREGERERG
jgi:hypothetical protein